MRIVVRIVVRILPVQTSADPHITPCYFRVFIYNPGKIQNAICTKIPNLQYNNKNIDFDHWVKFRSMISIQCKQSLGLCESSFLLLDSSTLSSILSSTRVLEYRLIRNTGCDELNVNGKWPPITEIALSRLPYRKSGSLNSMAVQNFDRKSGSHSIRIYYIVCCEEVHDNKWPFSSSIQIPNTDTDFKYRYRPSSSVHPTQASQGV